MAQRDDPQAKESKGMPGVGSYKLNFDPLHVSMPNFSMGSAKR